MKSRLYGVACCVTFILTIAAYSPLIGPLEGQNPKSGTLDHQLAQYHQAGTEGAASGLIGFTLEVETSEKATSLAAVGWAGCKWCKRFKTEVLPHLVEEGYDVRYVDIAEWKGPKVKTGPTLFFFADRDKIIKIHRGYMTVEQVKKYLDKPSLK